MTKDITTTTETLPAAPADQTFALLQQAVQAGTSPEALEKLVALQERILDRNAEQAFASAMVHVQTQIKPVFRTATNQQTRSRYAKLEDMHKQIAPIYTAAGFALMFGEENSQTEGTRRIVCDVMHKEGHTRQYHIDLPLDDRGIKGMVNKTGTHAMASTMSYGRRILEAQIFGVVFTDQDDDGNLGGVKAITKEQAADIVSLIAEVGASPSKFLTYLGVDNVADIPARDYGRAVAALEAKRAKS